MLASLVSCHPETVNGATGAMWLLSSVVAPIRQFGAGGATGVSLVGFCPWFVFHTFAPLESWCECK